MREIRGLSLTNPLQHLRYRVRFLSTIELVNVLEQEKLAGKSGRLAYRLIHHCHIIETGNDSYRFKQSTTQ